MEGRDGVGALSLQGWSQLPPEILGIIFSRLERKCDLLNGRLVCRSWNQECRKVLQNPELEFYQTLTEENIIKYVSIISKGDIPEFTLPFHLSVNIRAEETVEVDPASEELYQLNLNNLIEDVESLCAVLGEDCIKKITLKTISNVYSENNKIVVKRWLIQFLKKVSRGLKILDMRDFEWSLGRYTEDEVLDWKLNEISFPALNNFICYADYCRGIIELTTHPIYEYIVQKSPHLENLEGMRCEDLIKLPIQLTQLKSLLMDEICSNLAEILEKFRQSSMSSPAVLQELQFTILFSTCLSTMVHKIRVVHNILECVSTSLKSLTLTVPFDCTLVPRLMNFPKLPALQYLHLKLEEDFDDLLFLDLDITPETLPMLNSVELRLGIIFGYELCSQDEVSVKFPSVNELTIHINQVSWISGTAFGLLQGVSPMKHLLKVFPNVAKLMIKNECLRANQQKGVRDLIKSLVQSPLSKNIQDICIEGFEEDFLGQVLRVMDAISRGQGTGRYGSNSCFFMKDVRKVRLGLSAVTHTEYGSSNDLFSQLLLINPNLMAMAKYFPALQTIEISERLFRGMFDEERKELMQKLTTAFPYLWVNVY